MKFKIFALFFLLCALPASTHAADKFYLHLECSPGQQCIDLAYGDGKTASVLATPVQELSRADIESASVQMVGNNPQSFTIELSKEASGKLEKISGENIGKRLMLVLNDKILMAPTINKPITDRKILISSSDSFWEQAPWLKDLIKDSYHAGGRSVVIYVLVALAILILALIFVLLPRMKGARPVSPE